MYQIFNNVYKTGEPVKASDIEIIRKNGTKGFNEISVSLIRDAEGKPIGFRGISRDVTERKQAAEIILRSEKRFKALYQESPIPTFTWQKKGEDFFLIDCNSTAIALTEGKASKYMGKSAQEMYRKRPEIIDDMIRCFKEQSIISRELVSQDFAPGRILSIYYSHIPPDLIIVHTEDITEHKRAEETIRKSEENFRLSLDDSPLGIRIVTAEGETLYANQAILDIYDYDSLEELRGIPLKKRYTPESYAEFNIRKEKRERGEFGPSEYEIGIVRKNGEVRHVQVFRKEVFWSGARQFQVIYRDITERKRSEDALKKNREELIKKNQEIEESRKNIQITLERLGAAYEELKTTQAKILQQEKMASIGQLAAGVAHEINNPMAFIASNLGTLDKYIRRLKDFIQAQSEAIKSLKATDAIKQLDKKRKELKLDYTIDDIDLLVKESSDGLERVQKIVRGLNRFSRMDDAEYKDTNINECIESSINIVWNELKHKATLHKDYGNLSPTKCYPQKLNQVFINLLINAIHAIEKKGKIKIKTWEKGSSIWVTVSDTGCGIPRENQSKIFEPFFTTKEVGKGTGLGLSISYEIMQRHKGEISFESKEGRGTTFTIRMPIV
jgi:PAS domain S-box-containing protein